MRAKTVQSKALTLKTISAMPTQWWISPSSFIRIHPLCAEITHHTLQPENMMPSTYYHW